MSLSSLLPLSLATALASVVFGAQAAPPILLETAGLTIPRAGHQATLLVDGRILFTGGCAGTGCTEVQRSSELYDHGLRRSSPAGQMREPRVSHTATMLTDGRVFVTSGWTGGAPTASTEIFDTRAGVFLPGPALSVPRVDATATLLDSGRVLVVGGAVATNRPTNSADLFSPADGRVTPVAPLQVARAHHSAARLPDGRVLLVGGLTARHSATATAEVFDPRTERFLQTAPLAQPRCKHAAVALKDGRVMILGGSTDCENGQKLATTEIYDPSAGTFEPGPKLIDPRYKIASAAVRLANGAVMIAGGANDVEVWTPGAASFTKVSRSIGSTLAFSSATAMPDGEVLVVGGYDRSIAPTARAWRISTLGQVER